MWTLERMMAVSREQHQDRVRRAEARLAKLESREGLTWWQRWQDSSARWRCRYQAWTKARYAVDSQESFPC